MPDTSDQTATVSNRLFSVLTTVYKNTRTDYFRITADSLTRQSHPFFEWIILAHGPVSPELECELDALVAANAGVQLLQHPVNLGIVGGMSMCLAEARGDYIVPMDADDVLTEDAFETLAKAVAEHDRPTMLYSDEDILVETECRDAYRRPDWDEVLNLASSYIWHLCAIRRDLALTAGLYTTKAAEWCHDWDSAFRIASTGLPPLHVPAVLYHWRQHPASSTNRPDPESGSRWSTRALLEAMIARQPNPERFEVADFPIFRGAPEWSIRRRALSPPMVLGIALAVAPIAWHAPISRSASLVQEQRRPSLWRRLFSVPNDDGTEFASMKALAEVLGSADEPFVAIAGGASPTDEAWFYEAVGLLELHPAAAAVQGPIVNRRDRVLRGGEVFLSDGTLVCPQAGKPYTDAGPFAVMHKPHCVAVVPTDFFLCRTDLLRSIVANASPVDNLVGLGIRFGLFVHRRGLTIAYSPLVKAMAVSPMIDGDSREIAPLARRTIGLAACHEMGRVIRGAGGFLDANRRTQGYQAERLRARPHHTCI